MGRHDIKLRRQRMTSRRIEGFKDYNGLLKRHRHNRFKRIAKWTLLMLAFIVAFLAFYFIEML